MYLKQQRAKLSEDLRFFSLVDIFEPLSPEEVEALGRESSEVLLRVGEILYAPADRCESLFVLKRGRVRLYRETLGGREFTLAVIEGGTVFGEESLTSRRSRNAYAGCMEESEVAVLSRADLESLIRANPEVGLRLASLLAERLSGYEARLADLGLKGVLARLAAIVLLLIEGEGVRTRTGYKIPTRYTHHQLGTMIGANREAVTRAFAQLREAGTVETENRTILVRDIEALRRWSTEEGLPARV